MRDLSFTIWVTSDCNMNCHYCYEGTKQGLYMGKELTPAVVKFIEDLMNQNSSEQCDISFHGGEPVLNSEIILEIIKQINHIKGKVKINYGMTTNAYYPLDHSVIQLLQEIDSLTISMDGSRRSHDLHRRDNFGRDTFGIVYGNALEILKVKNDVGIRMTVTPDSVADLYDNIIFFLDAGFRNIRPIIEFCCYNWSEAEFNEFQVQMKKVKKYITAHPLESFNIAMATPILFIKRGVCQGGETSFQIDPGGDIYPCEVVVGNKLFRCGSISDGIDPAWKKKLDAINCLNIEECENCTFREYCSTTQCKFFNYAVTGKLNKASDTICATENLFYILNR